MGCPQLPSSLPPRPRPRSLASVLTPAPPHPHPSPTPAPPQPHLAPAQVGPNPRVHNVNPRFYNEVCHSKCSHSKSSHSKPGHSKPGHSKPGHSKPGHSKPGHSKPGHSKPGHSKPGHSKYGPRFYGEVRRLGAKSSLGVHPTTILELTLLPSESQPHTLEAHPTTPSQSTPPLGRRAYPILLWIEHSQSLPLSGAPARRQVGHTAVGTRGHCDSAGVVWLRP